MLLLLLFNSVVFIFSVTVGQGDWFTTNVKIVVYTKILDRDEQHAHQRTHLIVDRQMKYTNTLYIGRN